MDEDWDSQPLKLRVWECESGFSLGLNDCSYHCCCSTETDFSCSPSLYSTYSSILGPFVCLYQTEFNQRNRATKRYISRDVSQGIGFCGCGAGQASQKSVDQAIRRGRLRLQSTGAFLLHREPQFTSEGLSADWIRPAQILQDNLHYLKSTDFWTLITSTKYLYSDN